jgi:nucleotide-binding universal stress UspA family protein
VKTILVPVDFSPATHAVLNAARKLADVTGDRVVLLHVVEPPVISTDYGLTLDMMQETLVAFRKTGEQQLAHLEKELAAHDVAVSARQVDGHPSAQILDQARRLRADYIVLGSQGHNAIYDLLVGSTAHTVLQNAPCPVVIVPPAPRKKTKKPAAK